MAAGQLIDKGVSEGMGSKSGPGKEGKEGEDLGTSWNHENGVSASLGEHVSGHDGKIPTLGGPDMEYRGSEVQCEVGERTRVEEMQGDRAEAGVGGGSAGDGQVQEGGQSEDLIESTRRMFETLLAGNGTGSMGEIEDAVRGLVRAGVDEGDEDEDEEVGKRMEAVERAVEVLGGAMGEFKGGLI